MKTSESIALISAALHKFHSQMGKVNKDAVNPHFKNKYASLSNIIDATQKHLTDCDLSILQLPCIEGLTTILLHKSGEYISTTSATPSKDATNPQALGSALTYAKRYAYAGALNLNIDEDDDAQKATVAPAPTPKAKAELTPTHPKWEAAKKAVSEGTTTITDIEKAYTLTTANAELLASK
tara:strand:- start:801 stop:1343 length:543 start_codon:yes stop_codon:yes gene_type:complete